MSGLTVPYFRPPITDDDVEAVAAAVRSGWLTSGPQVKRFEQEFAAAVGAKHALAVNSCTAALHLAVEALKLRPDQVVLVPTMTFAATAEVVRYQGAWPLLVDCDPVTAHVDLEDAERKLRDFRAGRLPSPVPPDAEVVGFMPVHVGGMMMDVHRFKAFAERHGLWTVEDSAHSFPAAWRCSASASWQRCGENTSTIGCFSFYANKTITTGEGGMAVTDDDELAGRMRLMALHGLSHDAWGRYAGGPWDYRIVAPGFKYNLTDIAAALGLKQLARAEALREAREALAMRYRSALAAVETIELPPASPDRVHSWHLFPIRLRLDRLRADRNQILDELKREGVGCSVHWRPLHLHPYYAEFGWSREHLPVASALWERLISLPMFPGMRDDEFEHVVRTVQSVCARHAR